jgi:hypothetical protein
MKRSLPYLQVMGTCGPKLREFMVNNVPAEIISAICECSLNLLKGIVPLTPVRNGVWFVTRYISVIWQIKRCRGSERDVLISRVGTYCRTSYPPYWEYSEVYCYEAYQADGTGSRGCTESV